MAEVEGYDPEELEEQASAVEEAIAVALAAVAAQAAVQALPLPGLPGVPVVDIDALSLITSWWPAELDVRVMPVVEDTIFQSAGLIEEGLIKAGVPDVPPVDDVTVESILAQARNRLVGIGDVLWEKTRSSLVEGVAKGETVDELAARVRAAAGVTEPRSRVIARTEVIGAANSASIAQARSAGIEMDKGWIDTDDDRTRLAHIEADGQWVPLDEMFQVGGELLDFPGDPRGRADNVINCRCGIIYRFSDIVPIIVAAAQDARDSGKETDMADPVMYEIGAADGMPCEPCLMPREGEMWHAVFHTEGLSTGARVWLPGALSWREPPFALHWEVESSAHGGTPRVVPVGMVTRVMRSGEELHAWGNIDTEDQWGGEFARKLAQGFIRGVSMGPGSERIVYEQIYPDGLSAEEQMMAEPEQTVFTDYRIGELTAVSVPAQEGAFIEPLFDNLEDEDMGFVLASAVRAHDTATSDDPWDIGENETRLPSPVSTATARNFYAWIDGDAVDDGMMPKSAGKFGHHFVSADGTPGAASTVACSAGIAALHGARGGTTIPDADRRGVYEHLRTHLIDSGREPDSIPPFTSLTGQDITVAGGSWVVEIPDLPPAWWFDEPKDAPPGAAITVTDEGRLFGYLAPSNAGHRSYARMGQRKTIASLGKTDYTRWLKETIVEGGGRVLAGPVTMECMHAPTQGYGQLERRHQYYEDSCSVIARAAIGENEHGRWLAGAMMPGVTGEQFLKFLSCDVSLDQMPHPDRPGWQDFVGVLAVPVGGWPKSRTQASVPVTRIEETGDSVVVTASAVPVRHQTAGHREIVTAGGVPHRPQLGCCNLQETECCTAFSSWRARREAFRARRAARQAAALHVSPEVIYAVAGVDPAAMVRDNMALVNTMLGVNDARM